MRKLTVLLVGLLMAGCQQTTKFETKTVVIQYNCVCSGDRSDAVLLYQAVERGDRVAVAGMVERGKALTIDKGTQVRTIGSVEHFTLIRIEGGANIGERCWLPDQIVK